MEALKCSGFKKNVFFSIILLILLLLLFEVILTLGGYFYFNVYFNLDNPKIEEDAFRILFLGESTTLGHVVGQENAYPALVERILQEKYPDKKIVAYNKGIGAIETTAILRNLDKNMIKYKPHLVVLMAGINDGCQFVDDMAEVDNDIIKNTGYSRLKKWYSKSKFYLLMVSLLDFFKVDKNFSNEAGREDFNFRYIGGVDYGYHYKPDNSVSEVVFNLNSIIRKVNGYDSEIWFVGYLFPDSEKIINPLLEDIAKENKITYIGNYPPTDFTTWYGWHPNKEGHMIIANKIAEAVIYNGAIK